MKAINVFAIIILSILTFIWLGCCKLYETYIKRNILVQACIYLFCTLFVLRGLIWAAKPVLHSLHLNTVFNFTHITITTGPAVFFILFFITLIGVCINIKNSFEDMQ